MLPAHEALESPVVGNDADLDRIYELVRGATGIDLRQYKPATIRRRIARRMTLRRVDSLAKYIQYLRKNDSEVEDLCQDVFIHVTGFFRDQDSFEALRTKVFPKLIPSRGVANIRVWCPGCSTGEEVYSIAMLLLEYLGTRIKSSHVQLFGTDVSAAAIDQARAGLYPESIRADVSPKRLKRFFAKTETGYQINKKVREMCLFDQHDLAKDSPFSKIDLISCRNVLIYMSEPLQKKVVSLFQYALNPNGFLFLGKSDSIEARPNLFESVDRKHKIYISKPSTGRHAADTVFPEPKRTAVPSRAGGAEGAFDPRKEVERIILGQYAPAGLVVDADLRILQFQGDVSPFLAPASGDATFRLMKMLRPELTLEVRSAIQQAQKKKDHVQRECIAIEDHGRSLNVALEVIPVQRRRGARPDFLVVFKPIHGRETEATPSGRARGGKRADSREVKGLKRELAKSRQHLQSIIDDQETAYEELNAANEEILSGNEELRSTNEELETAKEELQSSNQELTTLNEELHSRNLSLDELTNDLNNVLVGIDIPILILGRDHRVRRFTPQAGRVLNLIPGDVGRPISDIRFPIDVPGLDDMITEAIEHLQVIQREVRDRDGRWYSLLIRPYRTVEDKTAGGLIVLFDIDAIKKALGVADDVRGYTEAIIETTREPVVLLDPEFQIVSANSAFYKTFDYSPADTRGRTLFDLGAGEWNIPKVRELLHDILPKSKELSNFESRHLFGEKTILLNARQIYRQGVGAQLILLAIEDITERRKAESTAMEREATIRALLNSTTQAILAVDAEGRIRFHNLGAERMFGYSDSELVKLPVEELLPERYRSAHAAHLGKYFSTPTVRPMGSGLEIYGRRKDGTEFPADVSLSHIGNAHGPLAVAFIEDITALRKADRALREHEAELNRSHQELRALTAKLISVQESNNRTLARELHDDISQRLAALALDVTTLARHPPVSPEALRKSLRRFGEQIGKTAGDIHQFSRQVHPSILEDLGLPAALKAECVAFFEQHQTPCEFIAENVPDSIPEDIVLCIYRVAQEALRNVGKHAAAERVEVRLIGIKGALELSVVDSGNGFALEKVRDSRGLGLVSMEERVRMVDGRFSITSQPGKGTSVVVRVPLPKEDR
jgi:two-component system CheB/CheR fusion protein